MPVLLRQCCSLIIVAGGDVVVMCDETRWRVMKILRCGKCEKDVEYGRQALNRF